MLQAAYEIYYFSSCSFRCFDTIVDGCDAAFITRPLLNNHIKSKHSIQQRKTKNASQPKRRLGTQRKSITNKNVTQIAVNSFENSALLQINSSGTMLTAESSFANVAGLSHAVDENYMLLVVNDEALEMVADASEQLLALDAADILAS